MKTFTTKEQLQQYLLQVKQTNKTIGFVPTMGALHQGHISLLNIARQRTDVVVCSIFVNPTQFNDPKDLERYPRPIQDDIKKLEAAGCDILFNPAVEEMYAVNEQWHLNIGELENLLEGKYRPGHYQGVTQVVYKLFKIVDPDMAFFGQKDYQQVLVIQKMVDLLNLPVKLVMCPILRENDGLAMSSRNIHLSNADRSHALILSTVLFWLKDRFNISSIDELTIEAARRISREEDVKIDYFEIADGLTLHKANGKSATIVALVAAKVGNTRLIDNIILKNGTLASF